MATLSELERQLEELETRIGEVKKSGNALFDCRIDSSRPGGAGHSGNVQYRLRYSQRQTNGKKTRYLSQHENIAEYRDAISRGKELRKLEKQRQSVMERIDQLHSQISALQGW